MKQWIIIGGIALVLILSYIWNRNRTLEGQGEEIPPVEEVIVQEDGSLVKKVGDNVEVMSPEEAEAKKKEIEDKVADAPEIDLKAEAGMSGQGTASRIVENNQYYQKIMVQGLEPLQKGYFYEAWLENEGGLRSSLGRLEMAGATGKLLYSVNEDKTSYGKVVVSKEIEDGNKEIGEIVLKGSFDQQDTESVLD